jgi:hypothetical protein
MDKSYKIQETRLRIFNRDNWKCTQCGLRLSHERAVAQLAHVLPQKKMYIKKYGNDIIHHDLNMLSVCGLKCNSKVDINGKDALIEKHVQKIREAIDNENK